MKKKLLFIFPAFTGITLILFMLPQCRLRQSDDPVQPVFPPSVQTSAVTNVTFSSAVCGGNVTSAGSSDVTARGVCWGTAINPTTANACTNNGDGTGIFTTSITGLDASTHYYVRAYATSFDGTSYGSNVEFTTTISGEAPYVETLAVTDITDTTAICGGNVISAGTSPVGIRGVCWNTSGNPITSDPHTNDGAGTGMYSSNITGLSPGTTYFVRAYATNAEGTAYGFLESFTTSGGGGGFTGNPCPDIPVLTDPRDGQEYPTVLIGDQCWLQTNMNYPTGNSWCYGNNPANCNIYGRLYDWASALSACPEGWHLPSNNELLILAATVESDAGKLKEEGTTHWSDPNAGATNETGFTALPAGWYDYRDSTFTALGQRIGLWSSTESQSSTTRAWYLYLVHYNATIYNFENDKTYGFSVRCLQD